MFNSDWKRHSKAAPFRRNDQIVGQVLIEIVHFPGGGISNNLADKAMAMDIPVRRGMRFSA